MTGVHEVLVMMDNVQVHESDKNVLKVLIKTGQMSFWVTALPAVRDSSASMDGDMTTSAGNWFQIRIVEGKSCSWIRWHTRLKHRI